uniref:Uncharacterized protein n=1 Tax=Oryza meridionalis TaxID=40149 RepID=A0A0E0C1D7_9ORYZ
MPPTHLSLPLQRASPLLPSSSPSPLHWLRRRRWRAEPHPTAGRAASAASAESKAASATVDASAAVPALDPATSGVALAAIPALDPMSAASAAGEVAWAAIPTVDPVADEVASESCVHDFCL